MDMKAHTLTTVLFDLQGKHHKDGEEEEGGAKATKEEEAPQTNSPQVKGKKEHKSKKAKGTTCSHGDQNCHESKFVAVN